MQPGRACMWGVVLWHGVCCSVVCSRAGAAAGSCARMCNTGCVCLVLCSAPVATRSSEATTSSFPVSSTSGYHPYAHQGRPTRQDRSCHACSSNQSHPLVLPVEQQQLQPCPGILCSPNVLHSCDLVLTAAAAWCPAAWLTHPLLLVPAALAGRTMPSMLGARWVSHSCTPGVIQATAAAGAWIVGCTADARELTEAQPISCNATAAAITSW